jgi:dipeptidyl aminopeptidase/acylaminoacyl peptidase
MLLWARGAIDQGNRAPATLLEWRSTSIRPAIDPSSIVWSTDGTRIRFLGEQADEEQQVFELELASRKARAITAHASSIQAFSLNADWSTLAFIARPAFKSLWNEQTRARGLLVSGQYLPDLLTGRDGHRFRGSDAEGDLFVQDRHGERLLELGRHIGHDARPWLSPDGSRLVIATAVLQPEIPAIWQQYRHYDVERALTFHPGDGRGWSPESYLQRFELVDTQSGAHHFLLDTPVVGRGPVLWAPDSRSVAISDVLLPLEGVEPEERARRAAALQSVEIDVASGSGDGSDIKLNITPIGAGCQDLIAWNTEPAGLLCRAKPTERAAAIARYERLLANRSGTSSHTPTRSHTPTPGAQLPLGAQPALEAQPELMRLQKSNGSWAKLGEAGADQSDQVRLDENMNRPPRLYLMRGTARPLLLFDPNPQLARLRLSTVQQVTWTLHDGRVVTAGLYLPSGYQRGKRYPLVIQTHAWDPTRFWIDGPWSTAYAAQPLAARGFLVLQVMDIYLPAQFAAGGQQAELDTALDVYRSGIAFLQARGLVDPARVGIIGFSHTCAYVKYALVREPGLFAAATVAEGEDAGYLQYMTGDNNYIDAASLYGGPPVGPSLDAWQRLSPGFHLDRVRTPLWINTLNPRFLLGDWEWFEGLRLLGKPVEMVMFDDEQHMLVRPANRLTSLQSNVDWFDFWLNAADSGQGDSAARIARWRELRSQ